MMIMMLVNILSWIRFCFTIMQISMILSEKFYEIVFDIYRDIS